MNPGRFYMPRIGTSFNPMMGANYLTTRGNVGLFSRITSSLRSINWSGLLSGANKTLNVVNQTIPLVRQAGPMLNNMKSMLKIARVFGSETNSRTNLNNRSVTNNTNITSINNSNTNLNANNGLSIEKKSILENKDFNDSYPNFFV